MMAEKELNDASRGDGSCIATEWEMHHEGRKFSSRWKKIDLARQEKRAFKSRKTMSFGAENYGLVFLT